jgi:prepilin-type processing-associated H-X9-DG protein
MSGSEGLSEFDDTGRAGAERHCADAREWGAAAHVAVWSAAVPNRTALIAAAYSAASLTPWMLMWGFGRRAEASLPLLMFLLPLPVAGALLGGLGYLRAAPPRYAGRGIATATLFVHGVHLAFLLLSMVYAGASGPANRLACANRLHRVGQSLVFYAVKNDAKYPPSLDLLLLHGDIFPEAFVCPSTGDERATGETMEDVLRDFRADTRHCSYVYVPALSADAVKGDHVIAYEHLPNHNSNGMNVLYGDGNVRWVEGAEAKQLVDELAAGHNPPRAIAAAE